MKKVLSLTLVFSTLLSSGLSFADTCRSSNCKVAAGSAAGTMVAGSLAIRGSISAANIEKRFLRTLMQVSVGNSFYKNIPSDEMIGKVRPGDKVIITYSKSNHLNVAIKEMVSVETQIAQASMEMAEIETEMNKVRSGNTMGFHHPATASDNLKALAQDKKLIEGRIAILNSSKSQIQKKFAVTRVPVTKIILDANDNVLEHELKNMLTSGKSIYAVKKVPASIMKKIGSATRNGWVLAGTAVALGLVTAEDIYSGKVARRLDIEFQELKK